MPDIDKVVWIHVRDRKALYVRSRGQDLFYNAGGKPKSGESDRDALCRELAEELGITLIPESLAYQETFSAQAHGKPEGTHVRMRCYTGEHRGEMEPASEVEELAWLASVDRDRTTVTGRLVLDWLKGRDLID